MRSQVLAAAFAAGAVAVPYNKRDIVYDTVTDVDVVIATAYVTVTAGEAAATTAAVAHYGHHSHKTWSSSAAAYSSSSVEEFSSSVAPVATSESSSYVAPTSTSVYVAPTSSSTSVYVAPTTYSSAAAPSSYSSSTPEAYSSSAAATSAAASSAPTSYSAKAVLHHNIHRANHSSPDLAWSDSLASTAQAIAESCTYAHNVDMNGGGYGQNIAAGVEADNITAIITDLFYNGEVNYFSDLYGEAQPDMTNFEDWGHFSQIVWKDTTTVGCYTQDCTSSGLANVGSDVPPYFTVCNYGPPGNYANEYADNIGKPVGDATASWDTDL